MKDNATLSKERREWLKAHGICVICGGQWSEPGRVMCKPCYKRLLARRARTDPGNAKHNAYAKTRRQKLLAAGICPDCGRRPLTDGKKRCSVCRQKNQESKQMYRIRQKIRKELEYGICEN